MGISYLQCICACESGFATFGNIKLLNRVVPTLRSKRNPHMLSLPRAVLLVWESF